MNDEDGRAATTSRTRAALLDAARESIVRHGYHGTGLDAIAAAAGFTRVTVYRHFASKRGLLDALLDRLAQESGIVEDAAAAHAAPDGPTAVAWLVEACVRLWASDPELMHRVVGLAAVDPDAGAVIDAREHWRHERVADVVDRLAAQGDLAAGPAAEPARGLLTVLTSFAAYDELVRSTGMSATAAATTLTAAARGVLR